MTPAAKKRAAALEYLGHGIGVYDDLSAVENLTLFGQLMGSREAERVSRLGAR